MRNLKRFYLYHSKTNSNTPISPREIECISYILRGKTSKQIAKVLELSHRTVEFYVNRLKTKLHCRSKSELIERILSGKLIHHGEPDLEGSFVVREHQKLDAMINQFSDKSRERLDK